MSTQPMSVGGRFVQRLSEGVVRSRLVEPVLGARPPLVVLSAPSGYGKTVLAAQIASAGAFPEVVWADGSGENGWVRRALLRLLAAAGVEHSSPLDTQEVADVCSAELGRWRDERRLVLVVDNVAWASSGDDIAMLMTVMSEAPRGSITLLTTRDSAADSSLGWVINPDRLQMSDAELLALWSVLSAGEMSADDLSRLVEISGRHPALAALSLRHWAMAGDTGTIGLNQDAAYLIRSLAEEQLSQTERAMLDYAALLGSGTAELLLACTERQDAVALLRRAARVLPLVAVSQSRSHAVFSVHQMVAEALDSARRLACDESAGFERAVRRLVDSGEHLRGLNLAREYGSEGLVVWCLDRSGECLLADGHHLVVAAAIRALSAVSVATDARLLLLHAECCWEAWEGAEAASAARLALRVAEDDADYDTVVRGRLLLARIRTIAMDYEGVVAEVEPLVSEGAPALGQDARADAAVALLLAHTFLGNREGLRRTGSLVADLESLGRLRASSIMRVGVCRGLSLGVLDGDWPAALDCFLLAQSRGGQGFACSALAEIDTLAAMLNIGLADQVIAQTSRAFSSTADKGGGDPSLRMVHAAASALLGVDAGLSEAIEAAVACDAASGDTLSMTTALVYAVEFALCVRNRDYALSLAERGVRAAMTTSSPVLVSLAELAQAMAMVAAGDADRGRLVALRLLPSAEALEARAHVLRARLLLGEVAFQSGDLAAAVEHLYAVSDYIVDKSPALTVVSYLRTFPAMLGPLALAMGVDRIPARVLNLLPGIYGKEALEQAAAVLTPAESRRLAARMRTEAQKAAESDAAGGLSDAVCQVRVLGRLEVIAPHGPVADRDWCKRKARLLFAMLVARAGTDVPRGEIIEYLWPEMDEERALNNFYVVWSAMKRALAPNSVREMPCPFVEHVHGVCRIVPGRVVTDLDEFEAHLHAARKARGDGDAEAELAAIRAAEQVYRGDVLPGDIYDDWFAPVRSRCRHEFEDAMLRAAKILEERGAPHEGLSMLRRPMTHDVLREDFYQAALRLQIAAGQRSAAIETYMSCRGRLVEDLGIDPSRETTALYEQVLGMEDAAV